jgi:exosortase family protein XrtM
MQSFRGWGWRVLMFGAVFFALQTTYSAARGSAIERLVIDGATVHTAAALIGAAWPAVGVQAVGSRLVAPGGSINVLNGCEGTDVIFLLTAAMLVAPMGWRRRLLGLAVGLPLVFALNQLRLVALFHAFRYDKTLFSWVHGTIGPLLLVMAVGLFFAYWLARSAPPQPNADAAAP